MYRERREGHSTGQAVDDDSVYPDGRFPDLPGLYNRVHQSRHALLLLPAPGSAPRRCVFRGSLTNPAWFLRMRPALRHLRKFLSLVPLSVLPAGHYEFSQPRHSAQSKQPSLRQHAQDAVHVGVTHSPTQAPPPAPESGHGDQETPQSVQPQHSDA